MPESQGAAPPRDAIVSGPAAVARKYRPELDGIRAICIFFTICNHTNVPIPYVNGSVGVDIFFALSGWLITFLLIEEVTHGGRVGLRTFYIRRFFRIVPLYLLTILAYAAATIVVPAERAAMANAWPYLATFNGEYRDAAAGNLFGHAWTLGIEEKFYLIWPAALALMPGRMWRAFGLAGLVYGLLILLARGDVLVLRGYGGLAFGTMLALFARQERVAAVLRQPASGWTGLAIMVAAYCATLGVSHQYWNIAIALGGAMLIGALWFNPAHPMGRLLAARPLAALGKLTYAIYLLHVLCINAVTLALARSGVVLGGAGTFVLCYGVAVAVAYAAFVVVEQPLIALGRRIAAGRRAIPAASPPRPGPALPEKRWPG